MSRFGELVRRAFVIEPETRTIDSVPWNPSGSRSVSSEALHLIPYFACVRILAEQISSLPLQTFRERGNISVRTPDPKLIRQPAAYLDHVTWTRQMVISLATRGNAVGIVTEFDRMGFPSGVEWVSFNEIHVDESKPTLPVYYWASATEGYHEIPRERIVHISWFTPPGKVVGLSPVKAFAASIGVGLSASEYGASWFDNGGIPPSTFKNVNKTVSPEQAEEITSRLVRSIRSGRPLTYGADWDFNAIQVTPEESQFIETMKLNATHLAAIFGIPPELVGGEAGGSLTYNNPEMNGLALHKLTLNPWLTLIETCLSRLIPDGQFVKFNADAVTRADLKTRYEAHEIAIRAGFLTVDEVRELENRPPLPKPKPEPGRVVVPVQPTNGNEPGTPDSGEPRTLIPLTRIAN